jgi:hypothetical protein
LIREGARCLLQAAIEQEVTEYLEGQIWVTLSYEHAEEK